MDVWLVVLLSVLPLLVVLLLLPLVGGVVYRRCTRKCHSIARLEGKTAIVTGSSAGIGRETALFLAKRGARVILACRNKNKAEAVADCIRSASGSSSIVVRVVDMADLESVRKFAARILQEEAALHTLVNNAGMLSSGRRRTSPQGFELTMATNHYGCFLLTNILTEKLKASAPSRVVNVSSLAYLANELDLDDLNYERRKFDNMKAYCQSKLCTILFTRELATRLQGTGVTVNCLHPGLVASSIFNRGQTCSGRVKELLARVIARNTHEGAQTTNFLAVSEEIEGLTGGYYYNCRKSRLYRRAKDGALGRRLWDVSCTDVRLFSSENII